LEVPARRQQVRANRLRTWREEFVAAGPERLSGRGEAPAAQAENPRLQKELAEREWIIGERTVAHRLLQKKVERSNGTRGREKNGKRTCRRIRDLCA